MNVRRQIDDPKIRRYFELETTELPLSYKQKIQQALGPMWEWLPEGAIDHDPKAYLKSNSG